MLYLLIFVLLLVCQLIYFRIAARFNIIDKPNERSSHSYHPIRGGGVVFSIAVLFAYFLGEASWSLTLGVVLVATVSFVDDIRPLRKLPRFGAHIFASLLILYGLGLLASAPWWIPLVLFLLLGWVNIFNFMDGINGITVLYALVAILSFVLLPMHRDELELLFIVGISCVVFGFFNIRRKARAFAGDVGSIAMALFLGYFMIKTIVISQNPFYLLFFTVYGLDGCVTILYRLSRCENILLPHRTHLYQYLANELKFPHVAVSLIYSLTQLLINLLLIYFVDLEEIHFGGAFLFVAVTLLLYLLLRKSVTVAVSRKSDGI